MAKIPWQIFIDLQCPYSKLVWDNLETFRERFGDKYELTTHVTSIAFHPQAFTAQCASVVVGTAGDEARLKFMHACFAQQESYMNAALGDARKSDVDNVFASIAESTGVFEDTDLTKEKFLELIHDWEVNS